MSKRLALALMLMLPLAAKPATAGPGKDLIRLLQGHACRSCKLSDADLVHADLRNADLQKAELRRTNLGQARLDGANLNGADLSFANLHGASLRGADLRGSKLYGADLRSSDLSGAWLEPGSLEQSKWQGARGLEAGILSHAALHNSGVDAAAARRWTDAEHLFSAAIALKPEEPLSWVARGISRGEQGKTHLAANDLTHAGSLFKEQGDNVKAQQLQLASKSVVTPSSRNTSTKGGNGVGSMLLNGALSTVQMLGPIALKALMPMIP